MLANGKCKLSFLIDLKERNKMNRRQEINKILHTHLDVNKYEDYTNYKALITAIEDWHESEIKKLNLHVVSNRTLKYDCDDCEYYPCSLQTVTKDKNRKLEYGKCGDHSKRGTP